MNKPLHKQAFLHRNGMNHQLAQGEMLPLPTDLAI